MLGAAWSVQTNNAHWILDDKELQDATQGFQSQKSFRKDFFAYCKLLNVTPHPKLCPKLDEEDKDLLGYDESDTDTVNVRNWMLDGASLKVMSLALHNCPAIHTVTILSTRPHARVRNNVTWYVVGAAAIADMMKANTKLAVLNLFRNDLHDDGAAALAYALTENKTLLHLSVANNHITSQGATAMIRGLTRYILRDDQLQHAAEVEVQIQAALEAAKKQKKKLERADVIKELNVPDMETVDGVVYGVGNATLQSLTLSGNAMTTVDELMPLNKLLEDHHVKLKTHLHVIKVQRMFPATATSNAKPLLSELLAL
ncbi:hypothetical protein DYB35_002930 [Aphanomyces astaci]|uniref:Uncharacterized protein n=1 Tax=Aphanomyces astaci TaxID=112090 RepID=A0A3R6Z6I8_APHAT|nr:hypothetical protein DYB35_002930 [Aphanomyces astaci]